MLDELQLLHQQGYLTKVLLASDATFNLERDEWTYTAVTTVYRCLDHRWRKSGFFLGMARHNRELGAVHQRALHAVHAALQERNLPTACQLHTDWFPGMKEAGRAVAASMKYIPGIEHLLHNVSKSRNRAEGGEMLRVPRLKARPLHVMASTVHTLALLPTLSLHIIALRVWLARVADADGWNEPRVVRVFSQAILLHSNPPGRQIWAGGVSGHKVVVWPHVHRHSRTSSFATASRAKSQGTEAGHLQQPDQDFAVQMCKV